MTPAPAKATDIHSNADPQEARVKHLHWKAAVDFEQQVIRATATWEIEAAADADLITFDTKGLTIEKVQTDNDTTAEYRLSEPDAILGQALAVLIQPTTKTVTIHYRTNPGAEALQWLSPQQTAGKKHPFLFTQSQAILARSWVPCQDSPGIRFTYDAEVTVPPALLALMSASNPETRNKTGVYTFEMKQPIPSYLLALAVGDVSFKSISPRSGIYAEPSVVGKAAWEFADLEKMIAGAEELYGPYQWERYDVLVLPPSFPFGGMENPRLTFATPTILSGDRSLTSLIAHELAHSWSGNLVTNATWNDFWLNEGFTVYFETRIMEKLYGRDYAEMLASLNLQDLKSEIQSLSDDGHPADTKLKLNLASRNPDDGVTAIAYNKGYFFLRTIEEMNGREKFDRFVKDYFTQNAFKVMTTEAFIPFIRDYYQKQYNITLNDTLFEEWIYGEGLPNSCSQPKSIRFDAVDAAMTKWKEGQKIEALTKPWTTHEWLHFINHLPDSLTPSQLKDVDALGHFTASGNAEILAAWGVIAIHNQYTPAYAKIEDFLIHTGRRKFLMPIYTEFIKTAEGKAQAQAIYAKARPNYHFVAVNSLDKLLGPP
ncbi:leukotriene A4 hydrolase C-terminal domain-containing protein [Fulvivirgaceae bacterium PWU37]|uniref:Aminopeptidase N n=2 Tax=Dawidia soli TaxID=2782352 RepID=A0AAP2GIB6_9BACT|nr:leukotriene A4 hydrolase C-terminal domain-containing protein [Dawidia soli]